MPRLTDAVFEFIENQNIDKVFLLPGGGAMHLVDAVSRRPNINFIGVHHEVSWNSHEYYSRIKSNIGIALVTIGLSHQRNNPFCWGLDRIYPNFGYFRSS